MKIYITKNQSGGFGGTTFELYAKAEFSAEEMALLKKYKAENTEVMKKSVKNWWSNASEVSISIKQLMAGQLFKGKNPFELLSYQEMVLDGCKNTMAALKVMKEFGSQEVFEFDFSEAEQVVE